MSKEKQFRRRLNSTRLSGWDYRNNGAYFITICTHNRIHFFGDVINKKMELNEIGNLAFKFWKEIPDHFPFVKLGEFVVMPNHIHGILIIDKPVGGVALQRPHGNAPTNASIMSKISPKAGSISTIIRSYKSIVTKKSRYYRPEFRWQSRFHDHIIRDENAFCNISYYIINNPKKWGLDKFYG